jgi:pimeloyl-ACP methyl ester carboxylesterase
MPCSHPFRALFAVLLTLSLAPALARAAEPMAVKPSQLDPQVREFDDNHLVIPAKRPGAPLVVFMPGTGGKPENVIRLLKVIAEQGYAVIGLEYPNVPAVAQRCPRDPDHNCSADFRRMRLYGEGPSKMVSNTTGDSIQGRLTLLLRRLALEQPRAGWDRYLKGGAPDWARIVVSGHSQGSGMAAYLAKQTPVARVVLFSSPWDFTQPGEVIDPWLSGPSATPLERWYGAYNSREATADALARAYKALAIPPDHIRVFTLDLPLAMARAKGDNPYHSAGLRDPRYEDQWRFLYGKASEIAP